MARKCRCHADGHSEKIISDYCHARPGQRDRVVLASKFFGNMFPGDPNGAGRKPITAQLEDCLRRLRTDHLDLYRLHNWDRNPPIEETPRTLDDLVRAGKIRYLGFSNTPTSVTATVRSTAVLRARTPLVALQVEYSLLARSIEGAIAPLARGQGLALVSWSPLRGGLLSGEYRREVPVADSARAGHLAPDDADYPIIEAVAEVAGELG